MNNKKIKIGFTIGDPAGIGIEIILKTLRNKEILNFFIPIIFGSNKLINHQKNIFIKSEISFQEIFKEEDAVVEKINILNIWKEVPLIKFGIPNKESARLAKESLEKATNSLKNGKIQILVTAPINKYTMQYSNFNFSGHTEYLEQKLNEKSLMLMTSEYLNIALVTNHLPIKKIASTLNEELIIQKTQILNTSLIQDFKIQKPKIAVLGLNPHAGDNAFLGNEEKEIIEPAIKKIFSLKEILSFGPFSSDSFFTVANLKKFDGVLAMYHDQGLIPFKTLALEEGANFTAGLSKIRISPNHGVAYNIAGKGIANPSSLRFAIFKAIEIYKNRIEYKKLKKNSLKFLSKKMINKEDEDINCIEKH